MNTQSNRFSPRRILTPDSASVLGVLLITVIVYFQILKFHFVMWDDGIHIYNNPYMPPSPGESASAFWRQPYQDLYIPVSYMFFLGLAKISLLIYPHFNDSILGTRLNPAPFHAASLILHLANCALVYFILRKLSKNTIGSTLGALLFALHPLQVESVAWSSELRGLSAAFFSFAIILLYLTELENANEKKPKAIQLIMRWVVMSLLFTAGLLCKPSIVTLPIALFVFGFGFFNRPWKTAAIETLPLLLVSIPMLIATQHAQPVPEYHNLLGRTLIAGDSLAFYIVKFFAPYRLTIDYGRSPSFVLNHWWIWISWTIPAAVLAGCILCRKKASYLLTAFFVYAIFIVPVSGFVSFIFQDISTVADRYAYMPMIAPAIMLSILISRYKSPWLLVASGIALVALGLQSYKQMGYWKNTFPLMTHGLQINPNSVVCMTNKAAVLETMHHYSEARDLLLKDIKAWPKVKPLLLPKLGGIYEELNDRKTAVTYFREAEKVDPTNKNNHVSYAQDLIMLKRYDEAIQETSTAIRIAPSASLFALLGTACKGAGHKADAYVAFEAAYKMSRADTYANEAADAAMEAKLYNQAAWMYQVLAMKYPNNKKLQNLTSKAQALCR
jgi:Tfp pilus assembly protein PilF